MMIEVVVGGVIIVPFDGEENVKQWIQIYIPSAVMKNTEEGLKLKQNNQIYKKMQKGKNGPTVGSEK